MKVIELFAGSRSIGKAAEQLGLDVWSTDIHPFDGVDLAEDILKLSADDIPHAGEDTILWASPPVYWIQCGQHRSPLGVPRRTEDRHGSARYGASAAHAEAHRGYQPTVLVHREPTRDATQAPHHGGTASAHGNVLPVRGRAHEAHRHMDQLRGLDSAPCLQERESVPCRCPQGEQYRNPRQEGELREEQGPPRPVHGGTHLCDVNIRWLA